MLNGTRILSYIRDLGVKLLPDRFFIEVPELAWGLIVTSTVFAFLLDRFELNL